MEVRALLPSDREAFVELTSARPDFDRERAERRTNVVWHAAFSPPFSDGGPTFLVVVDKGRLVCHLGRMPLEFFAEGRRVRANFAYDLFAHPELQKTGAGFFATMKLYKKLEEICDNFCGLIWTNEINIKLQQARKYDQLWMKRWVRVLSLDPYVDRVPLPRWSRGVVRTLGGTALAAIDKAVAMSLRSGVTRLETLDARVDALADRVGPKLGIAPVKNAAYMKWRYLDWPGFPTTIYGLEGEGALRGIVVVCDAPNAEEPGRIVDLIIDPDDPIGTARLLSVAVDHLRDHGAPRIECVATSPIIKRVLRRFLFVERPERLPLFFMNADKFSNPDYLRDADHWHVSMGDSEGVLSFV